MHGAEAIGSIIVKGVEGGRKRENEREEGG